MQGVQPAGLSKNCQKNTVAVIQKQEYGCLVCVACCDTNCKVRKERPLVWGSLYSKGIKLQGVVVV